MNNDYYSLYLVWYPADVAKKQTALYSATGNAFQSFKEHIFWGDIATLFLWQSWCSVFAVYVLSSLIKLPILVHIPEVRMACCGGLLYHTISQRQRRRTCLSN
jgi:hypothetical protein